MKRLKILLTLTVLASTAAVASAQDYYLQYPSYGTELYYYSPPPPAWDVDRFVYRENFAARRQGVRYRAPTYEEYYLRRHNELPPYGYYGQGIRHLRR